jgi:hypothetical protein
MINVLVVEDDVKLNYIFCSFLNDKSEKEHNMKEIVRAEGSVGQKKFVAATVFKR